MRMLLDDIKMGESATLEFKRKLNRESERWLKTVVAFANCKGGRIIFGVSNAREIIGLDGDLHAQRDAIVDAIANACEPNPPTEISAEEIDGKTVIILSVAQGRESPYYIRAEGDDDGTYVRYDASTRRADRATVQELKLDGVGKGYDALVCRGLRVESEALESLCRRMYDEAIENASTEAQRRAIKPVTSAQLRKWGVLISQNGEDLASNAYALLVGSDYLAPKVKCALFKGTDRAVFIDRHPLSGSVIDQIKESYKWVLSKLNLSAHFKGVKRVDTFEIPPDAIRELIVNAILHRSYVEADASPVSVALYDNRLEITSPGSLPRGMTVERMLNGDSICRNKVLAEALAYMNLIEDWGSGILRVKGDLAEAKLPPVEVIDFGSSVRVVIKRAVHDASQINTDKPQINSGIASGGDGTISKIVMAIRGNQSITVGEIAKICGKTLNVTRGIMTKMRECNLIQREGARKNGRWVVPKWVDDKVLESEERELCPVRLGPTGEVEYMISVDFTDDPILYAKLKKLSRQTGKSIEEVMQDLIKKAVADFTRKPLL